MLDCVDIDGEEGYNDYDEKSRIFYVDSKTQQGVADILEYLREGWRCFALESGKCWKHNKNHIKKPHNTT